jgi:putative acetyltransferase
VATDPLLDAIVLAAGLGSRFGGKKLVSRYADRPLIAGALAAANAAPARSVTVVTGADTDVEAVALAAGAKVVRAADYALGLSASLKAGIASLPADCEGVFVFLGDMPRIPHDVLPKLAQALADGAVAGQPVHGGQRGHPALIGRALFPQLMALTEDAGAGKLLASLGDQVALIEADDGVLFDVDVPESRPFDIRQDDLSSDAVRRLLALHLSGMHANSPPEHVHALDLSGLTTPDVTVWTLWEGDGLAGIGALKMLDEGSAELKSMRTDPAHLRRGVAAALLEYVIEEARRRGVRRISLETGSGPAFDPALALYRKRGFSNGAPFSDYETSAFSQFLHMDL